jgi:uncharacterized protein (TIGR00303 family)
LLGELLPIGPHYPAVDAPVDSMIRVYTEPDRARAWLHHHRGQRPDFACVLGFTATGLIAGISAAGATPADRQFTAIADAEFLVNGIQPQPRYPLPPLTAGASPTLITRTIVEALGLSVQVLNAGLPMAPTVPVIDLGGTPARCLSTGRAMSRVQVENQFEAGIAWGNQWLEKRFNHSADRNSNGSYLVVGECVVGGTTTALALLIGLGLAASGKVNSSHPHCNHSQKQQLVEAGLRAARRAAVGQPLEALDWVAAVGDPMQPVVAGMALAVSQRAGVMLAGGTQMLAVYALARSLAQGSVNRFRWQPDRLVIGTTRWVAEDPTGDTVGLAALIGEVPLLATQLHFRQSQFAQLRAYEQGFVKEGVGAGGCAIAAHLCGWDQARLGRAIEDLVGRYGGG